MEILEIVLSIIGSIVGICVIVYTFIMPRGNTWKFQGYTKIEGNKDTEAGLTSGPNNYIYERRRGRRAAA